jgi:hypothetical protein
VWLLFFLSLYLSFSRRVREGLVMINVEDRLKSSMDDDELMSLWMGVLKHLIRRMQLVPYGVLWII